jgi:hypothetical protein
LDHSGVLVVVDILVAELFVQVNLYVDLESWTKLNRISDDQPTFWKCDYYTDRIYKMFIHVKLKVSVHMTFIWIGYLHYRGNSSKTFHFCILFGKLCKRHVF